MQYPGLIKSALDYIEQNLKTNITAEELAKMSDSVPSSVEIGQT